MSVGELQYLAICLVGVVAFITLCCLLPWEDTDD